MRHNPAAGAIIIMLRSLKMHGMAQAAGELTEQGSPAFEAALPILAQLLKAETADREVRSTAHQLKAARFPNYRDLAGFDFASSEVNEALAPAPPLRVLGGRPQRRPGRRPRARVIMLISHLIESSEVALARLQTADLSESAFAVAPPPQRPRRVEDRRREWSRAPLCRIGLQAARLRRSGDAPSLG